MPITSIEKTEATPESRYARWKDEVTKAEKEQDNWHERATKIVARYVDERPALEDTMRKFNIFSTNVGILKSALYSKIPKVRVERRFKDSNDDVARIAALIMERAITQDMDVPDCIFSQVMSECIEDRLVPGMGQAWVRIETDVQDSEEVDTEGNPIPQIVQQKLIVEHVFWKDYIWSPCRTWSERRWTGRKVYMDRDSLVKRFGEEIGNQIPLDYTPKTQATDQNQPQNDILSKAIVYEIWDRQTKQVIWLSKSWPTLLDSRDDPLGIESFEPSPRPMFALTTTSSSIPVPDYYMIQDQYREMDQVNNRISLLVEACKVVGVYDRASEGVQRMMIEGVDNTLIPVDNWAMFAEKGGIKGQIDWLPLEQVIAALERLRQARDDIKQQIYELTGISDIARGSTKASETLGAQQIKAQFASIRIQELQDSVVNFASSLFRIKAQLLARHFDPKQIIKLSNAERIPDAKINPQLIIDAIKLIKDDTEFSWRVTVDADSMKMADYAQEKQERSEFVTSIATYLQSSATMIKAEPASAPLLVEMLKYSVAGMKGANELEGVIDSTIEKMAKAVATPKPDPEQQKMQQEQAMEQQRFQQEQQKAAMDAQAAQQKQAMEQQSMQMKLDAQRQEMAITERMNQMTLMFERQMNMMKLMFEQKKQDIQIEAAEEKAEAMEPENPGETEND
jgi:hypothetical protein